jgi:hypothetical protein
LDLYLKPAVDYARVGEPVSFYIVVEAAIGYRLRSQSGDAARTWGVVVNPTKSAPVTFAPGDSVIVLAEE